MYGLEDAILDSKKKLELEKIKWWQNKKKQVSQQAGIIEESSGITLLVGQLCLLDKQPYVVLPVKVD